uniref:Uncharacterized protein n=1 Tax=Panagrolaimus sp. JU765 TaxID=591449 RepID=A0AC34RF34_9BILA
MDKKMNRQSKSPIISDLFFRFSMSIVFEDKKESDSYTTENSLESNQKNVAFRPSTRNTPDKIHTRLEVNHCRNLGDVLGLRYTPSQKIKLSKVKKPPKSANFPTKNILLPRSWTLSDILPKLRH